MNLTLRHSAMFAQDNWLSGYLYRKSITLSRVSGAVTNYQMKLLVGESSGATGEDVDCGGLCLSTFNDLRFTSSDGTTLLDYWIESVSGTTPNQLATVWIEFDSIGTSATTFYMYYGKADAAAYSSGADTFIFYDDFSGDLTNWSGDTAYASISSGILSMVGATASKSIYSTTTGGKTNIKSRFKAKLKVTADDYNAVGLSASGNHNALIYGNDDVSPNTAINTKDATTSNTVGSDWTSDAWKIFDVKVIGGTNARFFQEGVELINSPKTTYPPNSDAMKAIIFAFTTDSVTQVDWIWIGNYEATEPAWGSWGSEEAGSTSLSVSHGVASITGTVVALKVTRKLSVISGELTLLGTTVNFERTRNLKVDTGELTISGSTLDITTARKLSITSGYITIDGSNVTFTYSPGSYSLSIGSGIFTLDGTDIDIKTTRKLSITNGTLTLDGTVSDLYFGRKFTLLNGTLTVNGNTVNLNLSRKLSITSGDITIEGAVLSLKNTRKLSITSGILDIDGTITSLEYGRKLIINSGIIGINGKSVILKSFRKLPVDSGILTVDGEALVLHLIKRILLESGILTETGTVVNLSADRRLPIVSGTVDIDGSVINFTYRQGIKVESGILTIGGVNLNITKSKYILCSDSGFIHILGTPTYLKIEEPEVYNTVDPFLIKYRRPTTKIRTVVTTQSDEAENPYELEYRRP